MDKICAAREATLRAEVSSLYAAGKWQAQAGLADVESVDFLIFEKYN